MVESKYPLFEVMCSAHRLPYPEREFKFHPQRKWKIDFAWRFYDNANRYTRVALEVEGGAFKGHGHRSVGKFLRDLEKYNELALAGWILLRCTTDDIKTGDVFALLKRIIPQEK